MAIVKITSATADSPIYKEGMCVTVGSIVKPQKRKKRDRDDSDAPDSEEPNADGEAYSSLPVDK